MITGPAVEKRRVLYYTPDEFQTARSKSFFEGVALGAFAVAVVVAFVSGLVW